MENIKIYSESDFQKLLEIARGYEKSGDDDKAIENYHVITDKFPQSFSGWWGLFHLSSKADLLVRKKKKKRKISARF